MTDAANAERGEVDIVLNETRFVLRPSYQALQAIETATGKSVLALAMLASDGELSLREATVATTEMIKAWGAAVSDSVAANVNPDRIGELVHEFGLMKVVLRLAMVLQWAVTGGCKADGTPKEGEPMPTAETIEQAAVGSQASPAPRSGGRQRNSGKARRTNSGRRGKSGGK